MPPSPDAPMLPALSWRRVAPEERFSCFSHLAGFAAAIVGTVVLAYIAGGGARLAVALVYGLSTVFLFGASALYHASKDVENGRSFRRRLDHLAIFFMIAGGYTPICYVHLDGAWRWSILGVQWGLVLLGVFFKLFYIGAPRYVTATIYVVMGWIAVIPLHRLLASMDIQTAWLLGAGGVAYTVGAGIYAAKRPDPWPSRFGFHEIFHLFVLIGAGIHYWAMVRVLGGAG